MCSSDLYMRTQAGEVRVYVTGVGSVDSVKVSGHELRARGQKGLLFTADFVQKNSALVQDGKGKYKNTQQTISKLRGQGREILADTIKEWN